MKTFSAFVFLAATALVQTPASGQADEPGAQWKIEPVVLDGSNSTGATLGLQWSLKDERHTKIGSDAGDENIKVRGGQYEWGYNLKGTVAADKERNPKNFIEALIDAGYQYGDRKTASSGLAFAKYETDQSFDNKQLVYGLRTTVLQADLLRRWIPRLRDYVVHDVGYGQVDLKKDIERQAALGTTGLDKYYRWDLELLYKHKLSRQEIRDVEFNFRYFREKSPPAAVERAGLDRHQLATLRFGLKNDLFVAYSRGKLPFDRTADKIFELGWSHNLK